MGVVTDFGWYMNTNDKGSTKFITSTPVGTNISNIYTGLHDFYNSVGWNDLVGMAINKAPSQYYGTPSTYPDYWKHN